MSNDLVRLLLLCPKLLCFFYSLSIQFLQERAYECATGKSLKTLRRSLKFKEGGKLISHKWKKITKEEFSRDRRRSFKLIAHDHVEWSYLLLCFHAAEITRLPWTLPVRRPGIEFLYSYLIQVCIAALCCHPGSLSLSSSMFYLARL